ncbi:MAG: VOC family protein [Actinomycetota bacterium]
MSEGSGLHAAEALSYTMVLCADIDVMRGFYAELLGLAVQREVPGRYLELRAGPVTLAFRLRSRPYDGAPGDGASLQLAFRVPLDDVDLAAEQLTAAGIDLLEPVHDLADFGHRVLFFLDPEGNVVEYFAELD